MGVVTPCREWVRGHQHGYGFHSRSRMRAHRWIVSLVGEDQFGTAFSNDLQVMHLCDNRACFRYDHLRLGTHADNMADMKAKGRGRSGSPRRKLTAAQVEEIRSRYTGAHGEQSALGREYGVTHSSIANIVTGRTWK